jgi:hypothetical protein
MRCPFEDRNGSGKEALGFSSASGGSAGAGQLAPAFSTRVDAADAGGADVAAGAADAEDADGVDAGAAVGGSGVARQAASASSETKAAVGWLMMCEDLMLRFVLGRRNGGVKRRAPRSSALSFSSCSNAEDGQRGRKCVHAQATARPGRTRSRWLTRREWSGACARILG